MNHPDPIGQFYSDDKQCPTSCDRDRITAQPTPSVTVPDIALTADAVLPQSARQREASRTMWILIVSGAVTIGINIHQYLSVTKNLMVTEQKLVQGNWMQVVRPASREFLETARVVFALLVLFGAVSIAMGANVKSLPLLGTLIGIALNLGALVMTAYFLGQEQLGRARSLIYFAVAAQLICSMPNIMAKDQKEPA